MVIGAGFTGLATAWRVRDGAEVTVLEASDRPGGMIHTVDFDGCRFDVGADAFLARRPEAERLARDLGFGDEDLVAPATGNVLLWRDGRLRRLPRGTVMGAPTDIVSLATSRVLSPAQLARAAAEPAVALFRRGEARAFDDISVGELVSRRFGRAVADRLVDPLLAGVYAGDLFDLSARATVPQLWHAATTGSIRRHFKRQSTTKPAVDTPVFLTVRGGLSRLVTRMADTLGSALRLGEVVERIDPVVGGRWRITTKHATSYEADHVIVAVPPAVASGVLSTVDRVVAEKLSDFAAASVGVVALSYPNASRDTLPAASGILAARSNDTSIVKAVTFSTRKWPHMAAHPRVLLRASVGRIGDTRALALNDEALIAQVDAEVRAMTGMVDSPVATMVMRWPAALPQYAVGHLETVAGLRDRLAASGPGIHLAGAAFDGLGLAARGAEADRLAQLIMP
ncbi:MAG: protoporphyrinogen oxidase [Nitriliruptoraceae bacterium]